MLEVGLARADITGFIPGIGLMGWGLHHQKADGVAAPLHARAFVVRDPDAGRKVAYVACELWGITQAVRQGVLDALAARHPARGLGEANLMLTATHTHSGPGGYSHFVFYNASIAGFCQEVLDTIVDGIVRAVVAADDALVPGRVRWGRGTIGLDDPVAFNRSPTAYNLNPDVEPVTWKERHRATDRRTSVLAFEDASGRPLGLASFFPVHGTSLHSDFALVHPDNKGCAALEIEEEAARAGNPGYVAVFGQGAAGDVSPNFRWDRKRRLMIGAVDDDLASAGLNGHIQARATKEVAAAAREITGPLDGAIIYEDFEHIVADPEFTGGREGCHTGTSAIGLSMIMGTSEGWGPLFPYRRTVAAINALVGAGRRARSSLARRLGRPYEAWDVHRNKAYFAETGLGPDAIAFHLFRMADPPLPSWVDAGVRYFHVLTQAGAVGPNPFTPTILPVQILRIGPVALVGVQGEPTTVAGLRLERTALARLAPAGIDHVLIAAYANAYAGYTTTAEEYVAQRYEGGSTLFGQWSLAATQTVVDRLARRMLFPPERRPTDLGPRPHTFDPDELARRSFPL